MDGVKIRIPDIRIRNVSLINIIQIGYNHKTGNKIQILKANTQIIRLSSY